MIYRLHRPKAAFSLIEAAIVLGLVGLVIGGIWAASTAVSANHRQSKILTSLLDISQRIHAAYPLGADGLGSTVPWSSVEQFLFPADRLVAKSAISATLRTNMIGSGPNIYRAEGDSFYVTSFQANTFTQDSTTYDFINYELIGLNQADCKWLVNWAIGNAPTRLSSIVRAAQSIYISIGNENGGNQAGGTLSYTQGLCYNSSNNIVRLRVAWPY